MTQCQTIAEIERVRRANNKLWVNLLRIALEADPKRAKATLRAINRNDREIGRLLGRLAK